MKIYFAGPLFTNAEREWNVKLTGLLRSKGLNIWLPQENEPSEQSANAVFKMCEKGIDESDIVLAIMDGPDPDSGTCFECGYAYAKNKPIFTVRTDFRNCGDSLDSRYNLMLSESSTVINIEEMSSTEKVANVIFGIISQKSTDLEHNLAGRVDAIEAYMKDFDELKAFNTNLIPTLERLGLLQADSNK